MALALTGCHNPVFDYEGDCEVTYKLQFVYDMNLDWADAFPTLVNRVNLYAFNSEDVFVKEYPLYEADGFGPGYSLTLDVPAGDYTLVAWAALETGTTMADCYTIPTLTPGTSTLQDLTCTINTYASDKYGECSFERLPFLYYGNLEVNLPDSQDGADYVYTMHLIKDTNHVRAMVQKINSNITPEEIDVTIKAADGKMAWNNTLTGNETITYVPWEIESEELTVINSDGSEGATYTGVVADLMTGRFTDTMPNGVTLSIVNTESEATIFSVPVIQYALTAKRYFETAYGKTMTDQEFLDRQSEYFMTFFVDENLNLRYTVVEILSWRVVIHNYQVGD